MEMTGEIPEYPDKVYVVSAGTVVERRGLSNGSV
jgi:hypothetical protein